MTTLREAAQQALEAMGSVGADWICEASHHAKKDQHKGGEPCPLQQRWHVAYQALRAALAEPEPFNPDWDRIEPLQENLREHMVEIQRLRSELALQRFTDVNQELEADLSHCPQCGGPADNGHDRSFPPSPYFCTKCMEEPVPVAWMHTDPDKPRVKFLEWREDESGYRGRWIKTPLYIAPPQHKPLTEGEISSLWDGHVVPVFGKNGINPILFARAIERAHGIV